MPASPKQNNFNDSSSGRETYVYNKDIVLHKLYEDDEVVVVVAPNEDQLRDIILRLLRERPMTVRELHSILSGLASEDKIRYALNRLAEEGIVESDEEGRYYAYYV
ncbi:helix-turn-helix domain-containing protein [Pyrodictium occultum]|uniref:helix-turn-helix domain-containing protein n=1 Tax=Pyrodictium occultum TaxID=2309 RepID=UPI0009F9E2CC|nr:helix-turn-helix domain-containing protein [Pyrodictium occultum]